MTGDAVNVAARLDRPLRRCRRRRAAISWRPSATAVVVEPMSRSELKGKCDLVAYRLDLIDLSADAFVRRPTHRLAARASSSG